MTDLALGDVRAKKGSVWALFLAGGRLAAADYYPALASPYCRSARARPISRGTSSAASRRR
jgi:hypothetical protein